MPTVEPGRATAKAVAMDWSVPTHSSAVDADPRGEVEHRLGRFLAACLDNVRGPEPAGHLLAAGMAAQRDNAVCAEPPGRQDSAQADGTVPDHRHRVAFLHPGADRRVMPGRHHIGQGE
jgi:hypothetical protein